MKHLLFSFIILVLASGCSTLKTSVREDVDWPAYNNVEIVVTEPDHWGLRPLVAERLADWGLVPVTNNQQNSDLLAILEVTEGSSLTETGAVKTWPKNLLLRLVDRSTNSEVARSRYQLAPTQSPKHGLTLMVNDLRKHASKTTGATPQFQTLENKTVDIPPRPSLKPTSVETNITASTNDTDRYSEPAALTTPAHPPSLEERNQSKPTKSDWVPRFKGWQLWGDNETAEQHY